MNIAGSSFKLKWDPPNPEDQVDYVTVFEKIDGSYTVVATEFQPSNITTLTGVRIGTHTYVAKAHNSAGDSADYSNEVAVTVVALPASVSNLAFTLN